LKNPVSRESDAEKKENQGRQHSLRGEDAMICFREMNPNPVIGTNTRGVIGFVHSAPQRTGRYIPPGLNREGT
jgi:hypothetical protein